MVTVSQDTHSRTRMSTRYLFTQAEAHSPGASSLGHLELGIDSGRPLLGNIVRCSQACSSGSELLLPLPSALHPTCCLASLLEVLLSAPVCGSPPDSGGLVCHQLASRCLPLEISCIWCLEPGPCICLHELPALGLPVSAACEKHGLVILCVQAWRMGRSGPQHH